MSDNRAALESALSRAESSLARLVAGHADEDDLDAARTHCRDARVALRKFNLADGKPQDYRATEEITSIMLPAPGSSGKVRILVDFERSKRIRWRIEAMALAIAYLQYYYVDVYSQIASLPTAHIAMAQTLFT